MGAVGMDESAHGQVYWAWVCPCLPGGLQWDLSAFISDVQWASHLDPEGRDGLCPEKWLCLEALGWIGHQPGHWGRNHGAGAWHSAPDKTKSLVMSVGGRCVSVSCDGFGVTVYMTCLCGYIALYLKEKFLLRSY